MDKWQKETIQAQLNNEKAVLESLKESYEKALEDINRKTAELLGRSDADLSNVIYQVQYQGALKAQIEGSLAVLQSENFNNVNEYLAKSYEEGFLGTMYNMQKQGIPLIMPIDQRQVVDAITKDTKLSSSLYTAMGKDITKLKKDISSEISRGISTGMTYSAIAKNVALRAGISQNNAKRIARTEGHRINTKAPMDACEKAKEMGADVVKQWDATLDSKTRDSHRMVDGEIREIDEPFSNGLMYPSDPEGDAEETINCRCALLERARWAIDEDEAFTKAVEMDDGTQIVDFSNAKDYEEFKKDYWEAIENPKTNSQSDEGFLEKPIETDDEHAKILLEQLQKEKIEYNPVMTAEEARTAEEIIEALSGGDKTKGSCASLALAYIGQEQGWDVLDFRDGESRKYFSSCYSLWQISEMEGITTLHAEGKTSLTVGSNLLKLCEDGKEYYLSTGRHASIVRKNEGVLQYLELQSATDSGWHDFNENTKSTLKSRFGCNNKSNTTVSTYDFMIDVTDSNFDTPEFKSILGYINTEKDGQRKGSGGTIR